MDTGLLVGIVVCIMFSAFFSGSEIAFASVNKLRLRKKAEGNNKYAKTALYISENFDQALSTILIGNNLVNIAASSIATLIIVDLVGDKGAILATFVMTILILIFGEVTPKIIAKQLANEYTIIVAYPLRLLMIIFKPAIIATMFVVNKISKLWKEEDYEPTITEDELWNIIESVEDDGIIDKESSDLLQSVLEFSEITVQEIITPRTDMVSIDIEDDINEIVNIALKSTYSRIPVYEGNVDNILGVLYVGRFFKTLLDVTDYEEIDIRKELIDAYFVHETMTVTEVFKQLKEMQLQLAIVTDEFGGTTGCITIEDILELLVGDIWDELDEVCNDCLEIELDKYEVSGDIPIRDFADIIGVDDQQFETEYTTMGGLTMELLNDMPSMGDVVETEDFILEVIEIEGLRIEKLQITWKSNK